ncbi:uncharacterized protein BP5553_10479 [Venustampulla echinocandica]|uniref:chitinase n=1 Tax=Venustampulla echinocandica TaxID=2656787 RepID=A0A370T9F0_9HELO|nr:uncharacterized protein BP5553_10479 [Venustampulla echinocandica]RDL30201.1 hypothetical protein BP5553_10479 [Venustampulla echinocandica]
MTPEDILAEHELRRERERFRKRKNGLIKKSEQLRRVYVCDIEVKIRDRGSGFWYLYRTTREEFPSFAQLREDYPAMIAEDLLPENFTTEDEGSNDEYDDGESSREARATRRRVKDIRLKTRKGGKGVRQATPKKKVAREAPRPSLSPPPFLKLPVRSVYNKGIDARGCRGLQTASACSDKDPWVLPPVPVLLAIYDRNFTPQQLPASRLTHVLYAFANVKPDTGEVYLSDTKADTQKLLTRDSRGDGSGSNLHGCLEQLYLLKKQNRNLKVLLSIGGWDYSSNFAVPASTPAGRSTFASSAVFLVKNLGLDGLDIDWEYPLGDAQALDYVLLLQAVRSALDAYGDSLEPQHRFTLTVASSAGPAIYQQMRLVDMNRYVDFWNLMAYDYAGSWSAVAGDQANLFPSPSNPATTPFNTEMAVMYYISQGILASKIVLGMPLYGRSFEATEGRGRPFHGVGRGSWDAGAYDLKVLPLDEAPEVHDNETGSSYSYSAAKKEWISYDTVDVAKQKAAWIRQMGLGGAMWWESSGDRLGEKSLIQNVVGFLSGEGGGLESSPNQLLYSDSTYENLRAGMPDSGHLPSASTAASVPGTRSCSSLQTSGLPVPSPISGTVTISLNSTLTSTPATSLATRRDTDQTLTAKGGTLTITPSAIYASSPPGIIVVGTTTTTITPPSSPATPACGCGTYFCELVHKEFGLRC